METQIKYTLNLSGCEWLAKIEDALSTLSDELGIGEVDIEQLSQGSLYSNSEAYKGYQLLWELVNNVRGPGNVHSPGDCTQYSYTQEELEERTYPEAIDYLLSEGYLEVYDPLEEIVNTVFEILDEYLYASPYSSSGPRGRTKRKSPDTEGHLEPPLIAKIRKAPENWLKNMNTLVETYFALYHHRTRENTHESRKELAVKIIKEIILLDINKE